MADYAVEVDEAKCCGAGLCADALPTVFDQDDQGVVVLLTSTPPAELLDQVDEVEFACPSGAIRVRRAENPAA